MGIMDKLVPLFSTLPSPKVILIEDPLLGFAHRVLQIAVLVGIIINLAQNPPVYIEQPTGVASFFASRGTLAELQAAGNASYCSNSSRYGYGDIYCNSTRDDGFGLFCGETSHCCRPPLPLHVSLCFFMFL